MKTAVYPGSFDPVTNGHLDIIERAARLFERVIVAVFKNPAKIPLFTQEERVAILRQTTQHLPNVEIDSFDGLLVNYARQHNAEVVIRGLRAMSDFENEFQMALTNRQLNPDIETVFLMTSSKYSFLSSSAVKEIASFGGSLDDLVDFVPVAVAEKVLAKYTAKSCERCGRQKR